MVVSTWTVVQEVHGSNLGKGEDFIYLIIYLVSFIQFSFLYRLINITHNEIMCQRGANDDVEERIIVMKF